MDCAYGVRAATNRDLLSQRSDGTAAALAERHRLVVRVELLGRTHPTQSQKLRLRSPLKAKWYVKAFARRSAAYEELQKWHDAFEDLKKAVELDPSLRSKDSWQRVSREFFAPI
eukprot:Skav233117  [mRNA]  locus=scaffold1342:369779:381263:- [translate_table: standard]